MIILLKTGNNVPIYLNDRLPDFPINIFTITQSIDSSVDGNRTRKE